jgi:GH24 family phage-related lysozyme (muramidase)
METSAAGIDLVKRSEGFRAQAYLDVAGVRTIGYGHRLLHSDSFKDGVDEQLAGHMLACDLDDAEAAVTRLVKVPLNQGQFDALVDFTFNLGEGRLAGSTLLADLNKGYYNDAAKQLLCWDHAGMKRLTALRLRREAEWNLWYGRTA